MVALVEGLGAVIVIGDRRADDLANYEGRMRALAYGIIGGVLGATIALGPLIGGWVTTTFTWRYVLRPRPSSSFSSCSSERMKPAPRVAEPPRLDFVGAALSAADSDSPCSGS